MSSLHSVDLVSAVGLFLFISLRWLLPLNRLFYFMSTSFSAMERKTERGEEGEQERKKGKEREGGKEERKRKKERKKERGREKGGRKEREREGRKERKKERTFQAGCVPTKDCLISCSSLAWMITSVQ